MGRHRLRVAREGFKFSCAHMTVFPDGSKERLHGHNFTVAVGLELADVSLESMIDFGAIKKAVYELCAEWREHTLLAEANPFLRVLRDGGGELEFTLCEKRYILPREDVLLLPVDNISVESLASLATDLLVGRLGPVLRREVVTGIELTVEESPGQGASAFRELAGPDRDSNVRGGK